MEKPVLRHRYKTYRQALLGKITADQYMEVFMKGQMQTPAVSNSIMARIFGDKNLKNVYSGTFVENDKWWIACISKSLISSTQYDWEEEERRWQESVFFYNVYMHKYRDMAVLKTNLLQHGPFGNMDNAINTVFRRMVKTLGYDKCEFERCCPDVAMGKRTRTVKLLIPADKTEDDLVYLISAIEKYNRFIEDHPDTAVWDDYRQVQKTIKALIQYETSAKSETTGSQEEQNAV